MRLRLPWWAWIVAGAVLALLLRHSLGLLFAAPAALGAGRRAAAAVGRRLRAAGDHLVDAGEDLEDDLVADEDRRSAAEAALEDARRRGRAAAGDAPEKWDRFWRDP